MVEAKDHPLGSESMLKVFKQHLNGLGWAQIGTLWILSKASAICGKEDNSSYCCLIVDSVGYHILCTMKFKIMSVFHFNLTFIISIWFYMSGKLLISSQNFPWNMAGGIKEV